MEILPEPRLDLPRSFGPAKYISFVGKTPMWDSLLLLERTKLESSFFACHLKT